MNENAYQRLGEVLVDELLLRAGLAQTNTEPVGFALDIGVSVESETETVVLECSRINAPPIELRFALARP